MNILCFNVAMMLLGWSDAVGLCELMAVGKLISEPKFCSSLFAGTPGNRWIVTSCWEDWDRSFEFEGTQRDSPLHSGEPSVLFWFLTANARKDSSAPLKFSWCWICWRIHLDNPKKIKNKLLLQNYIIYIRYFISVP